MNWKVIIMCDCVNCVLASSEVNWSNGKAEICYRVEASLMGAENVVVSLQSL